MLNESLVHYIKLDIKQWKGPEPRIHINESLTINGVKRQETYTWKFTDQRYEWENSITKPERAEDADWDGWQTALTEWSSLRKEFGQKVKLWIGKPIVRNKVFVPGKTQAQERVEMAIALLIYFPETQQLSMWMKHEDWEQTFNFVEYDNAMFNMTSSWQNPATSKVTLRKNKPWE